MRPAISIIFLTTLIGAGQGLFLALYTGQLYSAFKVLPVQDPLHFYALGSLFALGLLGGVGLAHLLSAAYDTELYRFPAIVHPERFVHTFVIMLFFVTAAQWIVHRMIRALPWLEVLSIKE